MESKSPNKTIQSAWGKSFHMLGGKTSTQTNWQANITTTWYHRGGKSEFKYGMQKYSGIF